MYQQIFKSMPAMTLPIQLRMTGKAITSGHDANNALLGKEPGKVLIEQKTTRRGV